MLDHTFSISVLLQSILQ